MKAFPPYLEGIAGLDASDLATLDRSERDHEREVAPDLEERIRDLAVRIREARRRLWQPQAVEWNACCDMFEAQLEQHELYGWRLARLEIERFLQPQVVRDLDRLLTPHTTLKLPRHVVDWARQFAHWLEVRTR